MTSNNGSKPGGEGYYRCAGPNCGIMKHAHDRWWLMWTSIEQFKVPVLYLAPWNEALAQNRNEAYSLAQMLDDLKHGIWTELSSGRVSIDAYRRSLQMVYLTQVGDKLNPPEESSRPAGPPRNPFGRRNIPLSEDAKSELRGELVSLRQQISQAIPKAADRETRFHLEAADHRIGDILEPKK